MSEAELRVDRVILEVTWRPEKNLEPPAEWRWQDFVNLSGDPLGAGESVRVIEVSAPKVKVPPGIISALPHEREQQWIAAIRAAGGEVE